MFSLKSMLGGGDSVLVLGEKCYFGFGFFFYEKLNVIKMLIWNIIGSLYILYIYI